ncbi:uncharacterized protein LOC143422173 [Xylocopa sonorina]|uniref:uncharacterized protein LOC143422173 n=1 Tax=Xylocopa sonorina TaxID=1818115 RepID=UPI00403B2DB5
MFNAMYLLIYLFIAVLPLAHSFLKIHHLMTPDEVMGIFHTTHDAVPYYELVPILYSMSVINDSSTAKLRLKAFEQSFELNLNSTDGYLASEDTPVWTVTTNQGLPNGLQYDLLPNVISIQS